MKTGFLMAFSALAMIISCNKSESGNKDSVKSLTSENKAVTEKTIDGRKMGTESISYKGPDGSLNKVTFVNTDKFNTINFKLDKYEFSLGRSTLTPTGAKYKRGAIRSELKGDSLFIIIDKNVIPLVKVK